MEQAKQRGNMENGNISYRIDRKNWIIIWIVGLVGQLCWNVENQWFNTFVYAKVGPYAEVIAWMTAISAAATTFATFTFGTMSDRIGKRKPFIFIGYILWGAFTIAFGTLEFLPKNSVLLAGTMVVVMDACMSFFGSMGNDVGFNSWTTDVTNEHNRGQLGAAIATQPVLATIIGTVGSGMLIEFCGYFPFFIATGIFVSVVGVLGVLQMKEGPSLTPVKDEKGFWHQVFSVFNFKTFLKNKELFLVFFIMAIYFSCFNFYYAHVGNYFIYTLGFSEGTSGIIQGVGLLLAVLTTIPATKMINKGKHARMIQISVAATMAGLFLLGVCGSQIILIEIGIFVAGVGYVLMMQTTTAWIKNLYPEDSRGQYEGIRIIFFVLIPMIVGPTTASFIIRYFGVPVVIEGVSGKAPSGTLFLCGAIFSILTLIPLYFAEKERIKKS